MPEEHSWYRRKGRRSRTPYGLCAQSTRSAAARGQADSSPGHSPRVRVPSGGDSGDVSSASPPATLAAFAQGWPSNKTGCLPLRRGATSGKAHKVGRRMEVQEALPRRALLATPVARTRAPGAPGHNERSAPESKPPPKGRAEHIGQPLGAPAGSLSGSGLRDAHGPYRLCCLPTPLFGGGLLFHSIAWLAKTPVPLDPLICRFSDPEPKF